MFFRQFLDKRNHNGLLILAILFLFISTSSHSQFVLYDNTSTGLPINKATSIGVTLVEDIFIGTRDQGIIHKSVLGWDNYYKPVTSNFPNNYIQDVYVAGSEVIISTQYGGVGIFKGQGWTTMNSSTTSGNIPDDQVEAACYDSKGNLWMATFLGLVMDSVASDEWKLFNMSNFPVMPTNHITKLVIDSKDIKWMGTSDGVLRLKDSVFTLYNTSNSSLPSNEITTLALDADENLWVGTMRGVAKYSGTSWTVYTNANTSGGLLSDTINDIVFDSYGNVFFATYNGLSVIKDGVWYNYSTKNSNLPNDNILAVAVSLQNDNKKVYLVVHDFGIAELEHAVLSTLPNEAATISVYPNPASERVTVVSDLLKPGPMEIAIQDLLGNIVYQNTVNTEQGRVDLELPPLNSGIYICQMTNAHRILTTSIVIK